MTLPKLDMLYYFAVLADTQNFGLAAKKLFITQQALSKAICKLETLLGVRLIQRQPWALTPQGRLFYKKTLTLLKEFNAFEARHAQLQDCKNDFAIGVLAGFQNLSIPAIQKLKQANAGLNYKVQSFSSLFALRNAVQNQDIDLALYLSLPLAEYKPYECVLKSQMLLVSSPEAVNAYGQTWQHHPLIEYDCPHLWAPFMKWPMAKYPCEIIAKAEFETALQLALKGLGALWVPECLVRFELSQKRLRVIQAEHCQGLQLLGLWGKQSKKDWQAHSFI